MPVFAIKASGQAENHICISPKATFKISQEAISDKNSCFWKTNILFSKGQHECVTLNEGICWPADFYISPDEKWILQIQKTSSGENNGFLYWVETNHRVWKMADTLRPLALGFMWRLANITESDLYHIGIEFDAWDTKAGLLYFTFHASYMRKSGEGLERKLAYDLKENKIIEPKKNSATPRPN